MTTKERAVHAIQGLPEACPERRRRNASIEDAMERLLLLAKATFPALARLASSPGTTRLGWIASTESSQKEHGNGYARS
ncbi:MAG: hypothetical protein RBR19_08235 [Sedimentisphaerales bacterium]|jgi:hypothetical protein|nr:hypothetical protein [Sedimentisphaerales bacterium]